MAAGSAEILIEAEGLTRWFGSLCAVDDVSFRIRRGEVVGFLGPNGAGKSTTMRMLTGSLVPDAGAARIAGQEVQGRSGLRARRQLGFLPETTPLYGGMRVDRYLAFVGRLRGLRGQRLRSALERVMVESDLVGMTNRRIGALSKGYRQRVGLAQALVTDPDVLILDEPTSGLDPAEIVRIRDLLARLAQSKTILICTHVLSEVEEVCQRALILAAGRLVADGSLAELTANEAASLTLTLTGFAHADEVIAGVEQLAGIGGPPVAVRGAGAGSQLELDLVVEDRRAAAVEVSAWVHGKGWQLIELRSPQATLEQVFLNRTRGLERRKGEQRT